MCNLYSMTKGPQAIRDFARAMRGGVGNMPPLPGVFPDYFAPIVRNGPEGRELVMARWGMPSPFEVHEGQESRSWRNQHSQRFVVALASLARRRESLRRAVFVVL
jgi:putative SOS response-associated peptidase YedK